MKRNLIPLLVRIFLLVVSHKYSKKQDPNAPYETKVVLANGDTVTVNVAEKFKNIVYEGAEVSLKKNKDSSYYVLGLRSKVERMDEDIEDRKFYTTGTILKN